MSRQNKVNPGHYTRAGRLDPDELGSERRRQRSAAKAPHARKNTPPVWETTAPAVKVATTAAPKRLTAAAARTVSARRAPPPVR